MDTTPKIKIAKLSEKDDILGSDRSLNDFPDAILKHILSFLRTKPAIQTSVLSKRWEFMWTSLTNLDFHEFGRIESEQEDDYINRKHFMNFVDRVLIYHDATRIQKFSLWCTVRDDLSHIKTWISYAVRHDAREFDIGLGLVNVYMNGQYVYPHCLFSCESMEVLKIHGKCGLMLPSQMYLPRLKHLTIKGFTFKDYQSTNLLFSSPALEVMDLTDCKWEGSGHEFIISSPKLYQLAIEESKELYSAVEMGSTSVTISAPELEFFNYAGGFIKDYHFQHSSSIFEAVLDFHSSMKVEEMHIDHFDEVLGSLQLVKHLQISTSFVQALSRATVPTFMNLTLLEITENPVDLGSKELELILNKCPQLRALVFTLGISRNYDVDSLLDSNLTCLSSTLKYITISEFEGNMKELFAVQILLARAKCLKTMYITSQLDEPERKKMENFMSAFPRASESCELYLDFW